MNHVQLALDTLHGVFGIADGVAIGCHVGVALDTLHDVTLYA